MAKKRENEGGLKTEAREKEKKKRNENEIEGREVRKK